MGGTLPSRATVLAGLHASPTNAPRRFPSGHSVPPPPSSTPGPEPSPSRPTEDPHRCAHDGRPRGGPPVARGLPGRGSPEFSGAAGGLAVVMAYGRLPGGRLRRRPGLRPGDCWGPPHCHAQQSQLLGCHSFRESHNSVSWSLSTVLCFPCRGRPPPPAKRFQ